MSKVAAFVPVSEQYMSDFNKLEKSLRKFHSEKELPLFRFDNPNPADPAFWYRAKPLLFKRMFLEGYDTVIGLDADQIITGSLEGIWEGDFDAGVVLNDPTYPIRVWDIAPYFNNGLVILKNPDFADHWLRLCFSQHFNNYQFREQDILNILCSDYHNYKVKILDDKKIYGEFAKSLWTSAFVKDNALYVPYKGLQDPSTRDLQLCVLHWGGGNIPNKGNYRTKFKEDVIEYIDKLLK